MTQDLGPEGYLPEGQRRASDDDREEIEEILQDALEDGRLEPSEYQARLDHLHQIKAKENLEQVVKDLEETSWMSKPSSIPVAVSALAQIQVHRHTQREMAKRRNGATMLAMSYPVGFASWLPFIVGHYSTFIYWVGTKTDHPGWAFLTVFGSSVAACLWLAGYRRVSRD